MSAGKLTPAVSGDDHTQGPAGAPVTLVEYGDFECPSCGMAYPVVQSIQQLLGDNLRFVFRQFPLSEAHRHAQHAAEASEAAAACDRFWEMHDIMFEHQDRLGDRDLIRYAGEIGLDAQDVACALEDGSYTKRVRSQFMSGVRSGVNGTPTFFINGERYDGVWDDAAEFARVLRDAAAAGAAR
jgi:protein-disulfide isomerase